MKKLTKKIIKPFKFGFFTKLKFSFKVNSSKCEK